MKRKRITYRERAAYHEAGHAVARHLLELRLGRVTDQAGPGAARAW